MINLKTVAVVAFSGVFLTACATKLNKYEEVMVDKTWVTTNAIDHKIRSIGSEDARVSNYYGKAKYYRNGTFIMFTPEGERKMQGDWSISEDGSTRTLVSKDRNGNVLSTTTVQNTSVTPSDYVYRIFPSERNKDQYIDILHKPVNVR